MPASRGENDRKIVEAVKSGALADELPDRAAVRITALILKSADFPQGIRPPRHQTSSRQLPSRYQTLKSAAFPECRSPPQQAKLMSRGRAAAYNRDQHHNLARTIAAEGIVLLKTRTTSCRSRAQGGKPPQTSKTDNPGKPPHPPQKDRRIGDFARNPRYQGAGSSASNPTRLDSALDAIIGSRTLWACQIDFARGYDPDKTENPDISGHTGYPLKTPKLPTHRIPPKTPKFSRKNRTLQQKPADLPQPLTWSCCLPDCPIPTNPKDLTAPTCAFLKNITS